METRASYVLIGAFALGIVVMAVLSVLWLGKLSLDREWDEYDVIFEEAVTGLGKGGSVTYNGIQVGEVRRLSLDAQDPRRVIARVRIVAGTPVKTDTRARLTFTGLTGVTVIQLGGGTPQAPLLRPQSDTEVARIAADESALQNLMASGEGIALNTDKLLMKLGVLLSDDNVAALSATLDNLQLISASVAERRDDISQTLTDLAAVSRDLRVVAARADQMLTTLATTAGHADDLLVGQAPAVLTQARATLVAAERASAQIDAVMGENRAALGAFSQQGLADVAPAIRELRATLKPLRALAEQLEAQPGLLLQPASRMPEHAQP